MSAHLKQHIKMTVSFRNAGTNQLLLSFVQPHKPISITPLSRWCVTVMKESVINVNIFDSHSTGQCQHQQQDIGVIIHRNCEVSRMVE